MQGAPIEVMQDPLHYPHGTKWMAPGPLGQVHPLPDDENIKLEMMRVARNHKHIYDMYNFGELAGERALCVFGERWGGGDWPARGACLERVFPVLAGIVTHPTVGGWQQAGASLVVMGATPMLTFLQHLQRHDPVQSFFVASARGYIDIILSTAHCWPNVCKEACMHRRCTGLLKFFWQPALYH